MTRKRDKTYFGYKAQLAVDEESGLAGQAETIPANVHDSRCGRGADPVIATPPHRPATHALTQNSLISRRSKTKKAFQVGPRAKCDAWLKPSTCNSMTAHIQVGIGALYQEQEVNPSVFITSE